MIGVIADSVDEGIVREFFELFKTPWEFYRKDKRYAVLVCSGAGEFDAAAEVVVYYAGRTTKFDADRKIQTGGQRSHPCILSYRGNRIPIYGDSIVFPEHSGLLTDEDSRQPVAYADRSGASVLARIGYDLFGEVRKLLDAGQPPANAGMPALELHIAILRDFITGCGLSIMEIPPVPEGYRFIACLTHDVDHPSIRQHKWDHTTFGFLYRAVIGSLRDWMRGRVSVRGLVTKWKAVCKLPFVHLGLARDFWRGFDDRYLELENGIRSTFFVIPFLDCPGSLTDSPAPKFRAARYGARDIASSIQKLLAAGCEVGLHGIDAWLDPVKGRSELEEIRGLTGASEIGVRMHWLYYNSQSPVALERAGADYDSTVGYNETVGYRAGTTQAYKPIGAGRLLELPLNAMDTAMFYPSYLGLSQGQARTLVGRLMGDAVRFGGCLTINWHDRSVVPERLWDACYRDVVEDLKSAGAWFATAGEAVAWFRKRRSVVFETEGGEANVRARVADDRAGHLPGMRLRIHNGRHCRGTAAEEPAGYVDLALHESVGGRVPCGVHR